VNAERGSLGLIGVRVLEASSCDHRQREHQPATMTTVDNAAAVISVTAT